MCSNFPHSDPTYRCVPSHEKRVLSDVHVKLRKSSLKCVAHMMSYMEMFRESGSNFVTHGVRKSKLIAITESFLQVIEDLVEVFLSCPVD